MDYYVEGVGIIEIDGKEEKESMNKARLEALADVFETTQKEDKR